MRKLFVFFYLIGLLGCNRTTENSGSQGDINKSTTPSEEKSLEFSIISEDPERDLWQLPAKVLEKLGSLQNKTIADIGAGNGYFTFLLAAKAEKVIAVDIEADFLKYINDRIDESYQHLQSKIETRLSEPQNANLNALECDLILIVDTYYYLPDKINYLIDLRKSLKTQGQLVIIDFKEQAQNRKELADQSLVSAQQVKADLLKAGFKNCRIDSQTLPYQYIIHATY